jgi:hypothetical protein
VSDVIEIERTDGGRALLALHAMTTANPQSDTGTRLIGSSFSITDFDALTPDAAQSRRYAAVHMEGLAE